MFTHQQASGISYDIKVAEVRSVFGEAYHKIMLPRCSALRFSDTEMLNHFYSLFECHREAAARVNSSSMAYNIAFNSNGGSHASAVCAAMSCLGGKHGPFGQVLHFLLSDDFDLKSKSVPGFGTNVDVSETFIGPITGLCERVVIDINLLDGEVKISEKIKNECFEILKVITRVKKACGVVMVEPNISLYTQLLLMVYDLAGSHYAESVFLQTRAPVWLDCALSGKFDKLLKEQIKNQNNENNEE